MLKALDITRDSHGNNGIIAEFHVMRHAQNRKTDKTYESHKVHALIMGRAFPGLAAFPAERAESII